MGEVAGVVGLGYLDQVGEGFFTLECLLGEDFIHVGSQDTHVEFVVDASSIDGIFEQAENLLPGRTTVLRLLQQSCEDHLSGLQVTIRELVVFDPALWDELATFLDQGVEPGEHEEDLHLRLVRVVISRRSHILERSLQVVPHSRWRLIGDLLTALEQDGRELDVGLTRQPEAEARVGKYMWIGFALVEAIALYGLVIAFIIMGKG